MSENDLHPLAIRRAQDIFLKAIEVNCPEVLESLAGKPLDLYRQWNLPNPEKRLTPDRELNLVHAISLSLFHQKGTPVTSEVSREQELEGGPAIESLHEWANAFNLSIVPWIVSRAGLTAQWWSHREKSAIAEERSVVGKSWFYDSNRYLVEIHPPLAVRFQPFDSARDSKADYRKWALAKFEEFLGQYLKDKPEYWRHGKQKDEHFAWLALFLIRFRSRRGLTTHLTSTGTKKTRSTVSEALTSTAELLGIQLPTE